MNALAGVELKIARAHTHLAQLQEEMGRAFEPGTYRIVHEDNPQTRERSYRIFDIPPIEPHWAAIVGDFFQNLRSALDHLAYQLVLLDGGTPNKNTYFPIHDGPFDKKGNERDGQLVPEIRNRLEIVECVHWAQPYRRMDGTVEPDDAWKQWHPLWYTHRLNLIDKHRLLLVLHAVFNVENTWWGWDESWGPSPEIVSLKSGPVKEGDEVARFAFQSTIPTADFNPSLTLQISLREKEFAGLSSQSAIAALQHAINAVHYGTFERHFRRLFD